MKKFLLLLFVASTILPGCALVLSGTKKNIFLVDAPKDLIITKNNEAVEIKDQHIGSESSGGSGQRTQYYYPGIRMKMKRNIVLKLESAGKTATVPVKRRLGGIPVIILESVFTFGAAGIIDLATGAAIVPKQRFIDVPALLNNTKPRSQKQLHAIAKGM